MKRASRSDRWTLVRIFPPSLFLVALLPIPLNGQLWLEIWQGLRAQAWDGSGHYALAQIYNQSVFPETFGWTNAYFAGIGFPNFYPPLFNFLVALLTHTHLLSFAAAFKLVLVVPTMLLPGVVWWLAYRLSGRDRIAATCAALALMPLLVDNRFSNSTGVIGLSHTSTFLLGLYTQPLGFVLLIAWYVSYACPISFSLSSSAVTAPDRTKRQAEAYRTFRRVAFSPVLLALALLANFFSSNVAALMVLTVIGCDLLKLWQLHRAGESQAGRAPQRGYSAGDPARPDHNLIAHLAIPALALGLMMFWLAPLIHSYSYVVTRPVRTPLAELVPPVMWPWYGLAAVGALIWLRSQREGPHVPFLIMCGLLFLAIIAGATMAPRWFPFQANRLTSTLNFMLAVPVGQAIAACLRALGLAARKNEGRLPSDYNNAHRRATSRKRKHSRRSPVPSPRPNPIRLYFALGLAVVLLFIFVEPSQSRWAFYDAPEWARIAPLLRFAGEHRDGRYLVENLPFADVDAAHDGRTINAYLGAQGNEALSLFFREGAPNVLFLNPLVDSLSTQADSYGISATLVDDTDYANQSVAQHLEQAKLFGTKYLVMHSPAMKAKLGSVGGLTRYELGQWSVFDLGSDSQSATSAIRSTTPAGGQSPVARPLAYKPALLVSDFSLKLRRRNSYDFVRFAEEQFASGWYDVMVARVPETKLDRLEVPPGFSALIVAKYDYDDESRALIRLKEFAQTRFLLLLSSEDPLFKRIKAAVSEFPQVEVIERPQDVPDGWIEAERPTSSYASSGPRIVWQAIQTALDKQKVGVNGSGLTSSYSANQAITVSPNAVSAEAIPVVVATTFHPNWRRSDGGPIYATTPFFMLTFVDKPVTISFRREWPDKLGLWISVVALAGLCALAFASYRRRDAKIV
jgi:hypothetical protein